MGGDSLSRRFGVLARDAPSFRDRRDADSVPLCRARSWLRQGGLEDAQRPATFFLVLRFRLRFLVSFRFGNLEDEQRRERRHDGGRAELEARPEERFGRDDEHHERDRDEHLQRRRGA